MSSGVAKEGVVAVVAEAKSRSISSGNSVGVIRVLPKQLMISGTDDQQQMPSSANANNAIPPKTLAKSSSIAVNSDFVPNPTAEVHTTKRIDYRVQNDEKSFNMRMKKTGEDANRTTATTGQPLLVTHTHVPANVAHKASNPEHALSGSASKDALLTQMTINEATRTTLSNPALSIACNKERHLDGSLKLGPITIAKKVVVKHPIHPNEYANRSNILTNTTAQTVSVTHVATTSKNTTFSIAHPASSLVKGPIICKIMNASSNFDRTINKTKIDEASSVDKQLNGAAKSINTKMTPSDSSTSLLKSAEDLDGSTSAGNDGNESIPLEPSVTKETMICTSANSKETSASKHPLTNNFSEQGRKCDSTQLSMQRDSPVTSTGNITPSLEENRLSVNPAAKVSREIKLLKDTVTESKVLAEYISEATREGKLRKRCSSSAISTMPQPTTPTVISAAHRKRLSSRNERQLQVVPAEEETHASSSTGCKRAGMRSENAEFQMKQRKFLSNALHNDDDVDMMGNSDEEDSDSFSSSLPIACLLVSGKRGTDKDGNVRSIAEPPKPGHDRFCWRCKKSDEGMVGCNGCLRSFHKSCTRPAYYDTNWCCPECRATTSASETHFSADAKDANLQKCLEYALEMIFEAVPGSHLFRPIDKTTFDSYNQLVAYHMDFAEMFEKLRKGVYFTAEDFLSDLSWIAHNMSLFPDNGKMLQIAKLLYKAGKQQNINIETCRECFINVNTKPDTWFKEACSKPHLLVWAKLKGFPYWPGKLMTVNANNQVDVRFFGEHDRAWVAVKDCYLFCERDPNPKSPKRPNWNESLFEARDHVANLIKRYGRFVYAPHQQPLDAGRIDDQLREMIPGAFPDKSKIKLKIMIDSGTMVAKPSITEPSPGNDADRAPVVGGLNVTTEGVVAASAELVARSPIAKRVTRRMSKAVTNALDNETADDVAASHHQTKRASGSKSRKSVGFAGLENSDVEEGGRIQSLLIRRSSGNWETEPITKRRKSSLRPSVYLADAGGDKSQRNLPAESEASKSSVDTSENADDRVDCPSTIEAAMVWSSHDNASTGMHKTHTAVTVYPPEPSGPAAGNLSLSDMDSAPCTPSPNPSGSTGLPVETSSSSLSRIPANAASCSETVIKTHMSKAANDNSSTSGTAIQPLPVQPAPLPTATGTSAPRPIVIKVERISNDGPHAMEPTVSAVEGGGVLGQRKGNGDVPILSPNDPTLDTHSAQPQQETVQPVDVPPRLAMLVKDSNVSNQRARKSFPGSLGAAKAAAASSATKAATKPAVAPMTIIPQPIPLNNDRTYPLENETTPPRVITPPQMTNKRNTTVPIQDPSIPPTTVALDKAPTGRVSHSTGPVFNRIQSVMGQAIASNASNTLNNTLSTSAVSAHRAANSVPSEAKATSSRATADNIDVRNGKNAKNKSHDDDDVIYVRESAPGPAQPSLTRTSSAPKRTTFQRLPPQLQPKPTATVEAPVADGDIDDGCESTPLASLFAHFTNRLTDQFRVMFEEALHVYSQDGSLEAKIMELNLQLERERHQNRHCHQQIQQLKKAHSKEQVELQSRMEAKGSLELQQMQQRLSLEKTRAVTRAKMMMWCKMCLKEAFYYCCWNTAYCSSECQLANWAEHQAVCEQKNKPVKAPALTKSVVESPPELVEGRKLQEGSFFTSPSTSCGSGSSGNRKGNVSQRSSGSSPANSHGGSYADGTTTLTTYQTPRIQSVHSRVIPDCILQHGALNGGTSAKNGNLQPNRRMQPQSGTAIGARDFPNGENSTGERKLLSGHASAAAAIGDSSKTKSLGKVLPAAPVTGTLTTITLAPAGRGSLTGTTHVPSNVWNQIIVQSSSAAAAAAAATGRTFVATSALGSGGASVARTMQPITMVGGVQNSTCNSTMPASHDAGGTANALMHRRHPR